MIETQFYLSDNSVLNYACVLTGLSPDEIEYIVGRFTNRSRWAGQLKGKVVVYVDNTVSIRSSFGNKLLWTKD